MGTSKFINHERASEFLKSIEDPIIRGLVKFSYEMILIIDKSPEGDFDLLYFSQVMEMFLRDRQGLSKALLGDYGENKTGLGL